MMNASLQKMCVTIIIIQYMYDKSKISLFTLSESVLFMKLNNANVIFCKCVILHHPILQVGQVTDGENLFHMPDELLHDDWGS